MRRIEMRAGTEFDDLPPVFRRVRNRHEAWNSEVAGDVEHPNPAPGGGELDLQIADVGIVELAEVHFRPLQSIVPPDGVGIAFDQFQEALDDRFLQRVAGGAAVGIGVDAAGRAGVAAVEKIEQAGRKIFEAFVAQRPDRRPFDLGRRIEWRRSWRHVVGIASRCLGAPVLRVAEQQHVVGQDGFARREIRKPPRLL